jgi:Chaperone of endosialidase
MKIHIRKVILLSTALSVFLGSLTYVPSALLAADRSVPFDVGETLDPGLDAEPCGPTDANCFPTITNVPAVGAVGSVQYASSSGLLTSSSTLLYFDAPGRRLGIGTSTPQHALSVVGNIGLTGALFDSANSSGINGYVLQTTGAGVAWVATSTLGLTGGGPTSWLDLTDTPASFTANRLLFTNSSASAITDSSDLVFDGTNFGIGSTTPSARLTVTGTPGTGNIFTIASSTGATLLNVDASGRLMIGTSTIPAVAPSKLYVSGGSAGKVTFDNNGGFEWYDTNGLKSAATTFTSGNNLQFNNGATNGTIQFNANNANGSIQFRTGTAGGVGDRRMVIESDGRVGIGTSTTNVMLSVVATSTYDLLDLAQANGTSIVKIMNNGNVGIGSSTPSSLLTVAGNAYIGGNLTATGLSNLATATATALTVTGALYDSGAQVGAAGYVLQATGTSTRWVATSTLGISGGGGSSAVGGTGAIQFANGTAFDGNNLQLYWDSSGNKLGVGTSTPRARLTVDGSGTSTGSELITNGTFTGSAAGWTLNDCAAYGSNQVTVTYTACSDPSITTTFNSVSGRMYTMSFSVSGVSGDTMTYYFDNNSDPYDIGPFTDGVHTITFTTNFTGVETITFAPFGYNSDGTWTIDNVSISEVIVTPLLSFIGYTGEEMVQLGGDTLGNSFVGLGSGKSNSTGGSNSAFGKSALSSNTTGSNNTAIGSESLYANLSGSKNTAVGFQAMYANTLGIENTALGYRALSASNSGYNTALGSEALTSNTSGLNNTAVGRQALFDNTTGTGNVAVGYSSLGNLIEGLFNTGVGNSAGGSLVYGEKNIAIGTNALNSLTQGTGTIAIGYQAGMGLLASYQSENNVYIGTESAFYADTNSNYNTFLGYRTGYNVGTGHHNIVIGQNADVSGGNASLNIGNTIFGSGMYDGSIVFGGAATGSKISIGSATPWAKFSVQDLGKSEEILFDVASTTALDARISLFMVKADGTVGIGTSTPFAPLTMASGAHVTTGGVWTNSSDRNLKENFTTLDPLEVLNKVNQLSITEWNYKNEDTDIKHVGPTAQDFYALFALGGSDTSISTIDPAGVSLLAIQGLSNELWSLASTTQDISSDSFLKRFFDRLRVWLADTQNGIEQLFAERIETNTLCVGNTCVTEDQLQELLENAAAPSGQNGEGTETEVEVLPTVDETQSEDQGEATDEVVPVDEQIAEESVPPEPAAPVGTDTSEEPVEPVEPVVTP